jgi:hypothetical protein
MLQVFVFGELKIRWYSSKFLPQNALGFASLKTCKINYLQIDVNHFDEYHKLTQ